jgi:TolB-like protein
VRVAIMPLRVLAASESPELSYLGVGIADAITSRLANVRQIAPRPTWAVLSHKDADSDPARVMNRLAVQYLLLGTVQPADGRYRVSGAIGRCR